MMPLDAGWAGVLGALIGGVTTVAGTALNHYLSIQKSNALANKRRDRLRGMLNSTKYKWRSIEALSASIGADEATTTELLVEIDARASLPNNRSWALVSRAPWPEDVQPTD